MCSAGCSRQTVRWINGAMEKTLRIEALLCQNDWNWGARGGGAGGPLPSHVFLDFRFLKCGGKA